MDHFHLTLRTRRLCLLFTAIAVYLISLYVLHGTNLEEHPYNLQSQKKIFLSVYVPSTLESSLLEDFKKWCAMTKDYFGVIPNRNWGNLNSQEDRKKWQLYECDSILVSGRLTPCEDFFGVKFTEEWKNKSFHLCSNLNTTLPSSTSDKHICRRHGDSYICSLYGIIFNFELQQMHPSMRIRSFKEKFLSIKCDKPRKDITKIAQYIPGTKLYQSDSNSNMSQQCSRRISTPVLVVSHDFVFNYGHMIQDVMNWWMTSDIIGIPTKNITLLNIDGLRPASVMFGKGRFIQSVTQPDITGPFQFMLDVLFRDIVIPQDVNGSDGRTLCLDEAHFYPMPVRGFLWDKFEVNDRCSLAVRPSYLYQKFLLHYNNMLYHTQSFVDMVRRVRRKYSLVSPVDPSQQMHSRDIHRRFFDRIRRFIDHKSHSGRDVHFRNYSQNRYPYNDYDSSQNADQTTSSPLPASLYKDDIFQILFMFRTPNISFINAHNRTLELKLLNHRIQNSGNLNHTSSAFSTATRAAENFYDQAVESAKIARYISNFEELTRELETISRAHITVVDLETISFLEQIALVTQMDVIMGFHGASMAHIFNMNISRPKCCGVLEIFPQRHGCDLPNRFVCVYHRRVGYANMARHLGFRYEAFMAANMSYSSSGTYLDPYALRMSIIKLTEILDANPSQIRSDLQKFLR